MTDRPDRPVIAVAGDWHGDRAWANARLQSVGERGIRTVLHVGDFGIWPGPVGRQYLRTVEAVCSKFDITLLVTPGNHEDWSRLTELWANPRNHSETGALRPLHLTAHVSVLPRAHRWTIGDRSFVSLGGAPSVDFQSRIAGRDWWPEEQMIQEDVDRAIADGYADVMVTHDAAGPPWCVPQVEHILRTNPHGWPESALEYARAGTELVTEALLGVRPRLYVHGHLHVSGETTRRLPIADYDTTIWSLHMNKNDGNVRLLDLESLSDPQAS